VLDLKAIREDPGAAREALARRGAAAALDELLDVDARRRELLPKVEEGRARRNTVSDQIAEAKRSGDDAAGPISEMRELGAEIKRMEAELAEVEGRRDELAQALPNLPSQEAPDGKEGESVTLREVGDVPRFDFEVRDHLDLGTEHGWIEME
jgi:seryl-tRNA synthetase